MTSSTGSGAAPESEPDTSTDSAPDLRADATLIVLAEELGTNRVFTTDRGGFAVYRIRGRGRFEIVPA